MILGHVADGIPHKDAVVKLFKSQTSKDELLKRSVFPVLIAYDSDAVKCHSSITAAYKDELEAEAKSIQDYFALQSSGVNVRFALILVPMNTKLAVIESFDKKLEAFT